MKNENINNSENQNIIDNINSINIYKNNYKENTITNQISYNNTYVPFLKTITTSGPYIAATIVITILVIIGYFTGLLKWIKNKIKSINEFRKQKDTIHIFPNLETTEWFTIFREKKYIEFNILVTITNISEYHVKITEIKMKEPNIKGEILYTNPHSINPYEIKPKDTKDIKLSFYKNINEPCKKEWKNHKTSFYIKDQFGKKHWVKKVIFKYSEFARFFTKKN